MDKNWFKVVIVCGVFLAMGTGFSWADPCDADIELHCSTIQAGNGAIANCLQRYNDQLSYQCRERLKKIDQATHRKLNACSGDARDFCRNVVPGYGRIKNCLMSNLDKLSNDCRSALQQ